MKKNSLTNRAKTSREGLPRNLALEKCVKTYAIKVQPSLFNILKKHTPEQVRQILMKKFLEGEKSHETCGHADSPKRKTPVDEVRQNRALACSPQNLSKKEEE